MRSHLTYNLSWAYFELGDQEAGLSALEENQRLGLARDDLYGAVNPAYGRALFARRRGRLHEAVAILKDALATIVEPRERAGERIPVSGSLYIGLGCILLEWNELGKAERLLSKGLDLIVWTSETALLSGLVALARLREPQGFDANVGAAFRHLRGQPSTATLREWFPEGTSYAAACTWFPWSGDDPRVVWTDGETFLENVVMARARIAHAQKAIGRSSVDLAPFRDTYQELLTRARQNQWVELEIELLILRALALAVVGQTKQALKFLERALILAEPGGYVRIFVDEGLTMAELLCQWDASRSASTSRRVPSESTQAYVHKLLAKFDLAGREPGLPASNSAAVPAFEMRPEAVIDPLTERELQVLGCLAEGLSNKEIAQALVITLNTVKQHLRNIYGKVDVPSRTQAVNRARELGLL